MKKLIIYLIIIGSFAYSKIAFAQVKLSNVGSQITLAGTGYLVVQGDIINKSSNANAFHIEGMLKLSGNWQDSSAIPSTVWGTTGKIILSGSTVQTIGGAKPNEFYDLEVNNSAGVILDTILIVNHNLDLSDGIVYSSADKEVRMQSGSSVSGGSDQSFVDGPMIKTGSTDFVFPVGDKGRIQQIAILDLQSSETFTAEYIRGTPPQNTNFAGNLVRVSSVEYWHLTPANGSPTINMALYWNNGDSSGITNPQTLLIAHQKSNGQWEDIPYISGTGATSAGSIKGGPVSTYSLYTLGSNNSNDNPLPIELLSFDAKKGNGFYVNLSWITASEQNNDYFTVERSQFGMLWEEVGVVKGAGNSNSILRYALTDNKPYMGISYYRLKQTDFNGSFTYSDIRVINFENSQIQIVVYPNPTKDFIYIKHAYSQTEYFITNMLGDIVDKGSFDKETILNMQQFASGVYNLHLHEKTGTKQADKVLKIVKN